MIRVSGCQRYLGVDTARNVCDDGAVTDTHSIPWPAAGDLYIAVHDTRGSIYYDAPLGGDVVVTRRDGQLVIVPAAELLTLSNLTLMFRPKLPLGTVAGWTKRDDFPEPVYLGHGDRRWIAREVADWHDDYDPTANLRGGYLTKVGTLRTEWACRGSEA